MDTTTSTIDRLRRIFTITGESAFAVKQTWAKRLRRIGRLVRDLRREGDVYVVCRRMGQQDEFIFVAKQRS